MAKMADPGRKNVASKITTQITKDTPAAQPIIDSLKQQQGGTKVVPS